MVIFRYSLVFGIFLITAATCVAQNMPGPFYEEEQQALENMKNMSVLNRDSVVLIDTVVVFDPETFKETTRIVESKMSLWEYCQNMLGIQNPNRILDGETMTITNPDTYEEMKIRWNHSRSRIDTIR